MEVQGRGPLFQKIDKLVLGVNSQDVQHHSILRKVEVGTTFIVSFKYKSRFDVFLYSINVPRCPEQVQLLVSARPTEKNTIVFNSMLNTRWDYEERRQSPIEIGQTMILEIHVEQNGFRCSIGKEWFKFYEHRHSINKIEQLTITGSPDLLFVEIKYPSEETQKEVDVEAPGISILANLTESEIDVEIPVTSILANLTESEVDVEAPAISILTNLTESNTTGF